MAELFNRSFDISTLSGGEEIVIGSAEGTTLYLNVTGVGFINEDSTWQLVQSNDKSLWTAIAGTTFTGENAQAVQNPGEVFNATYLGVQLINKATETAGVVTIDVSIK